MTPTQYLELERAAEFRSEYYAGHMYAMSGGSHRHAIIIGSLSRELGNGLKNRPCSVATSELRVRVTLAGHYTYPDLVVVCGDSNYADNQLVSQFEPRVEAYRRQSAGWLLTEFEGLNAICRFDSVDCSVALADIYDKVRFEDDALPPRSPAA